MGIVYDSAKNEMFVTGNQLYVAVISASSDTISAEIALGPDGTFLNGTVPGTIPRLARSSFRYGRAVM